MKYAILFPLLLCALSLGAQKSVHVARYLGDIRYQSAPPAGQVKFAFERAVLLRASDGKKTYAEVLRSAPQFSDADNAGHLLGIQVNGQTVMPESPKEPEGGKVETLPKSDIPTAGGFWSDVPDSTELERLKAEMLAEKREFGRQLAPRQQFLIWQYRQFIMPILVFIGIVFRFWAASAFAESRYAAAGFLIFGYRIVDIGHMARFVVFIIGGIMATVEIVNDGLQTYFTSNSLWWWIFRAILISLVLKFLFTNWVVPNPRVVDTQGQMGGNFLPLNRG